MEQLKQNINRRNRIVSLSQINSNVSGTGTTTYIYIFKCHMLNQVCSNFEESKSFEFDGRLDVLDVVEVL